MEKRSQLEKTVKNRQNRPFLSSKGTFFMFPIRKVAEKKLGIKITLKVSLNSYLSPKNCGPSVRILTPGSIIPLHCFLKKKRFGKRPYFLWVFFRQKDPSYAIFSKSREFKDIKYDTYMVPNSSSGLIFAKIRAKYVHFLAEIWA